MNVLHVYKSYITDSMGGVEQVIKQITLGTSKLGVNNRILCLSREPHASILHHPEADIYRYPLSFEIASTGFSLAALKGFRELVSWADIIHYHYPWPFADMLHFLSKVTKPSIVTYHSDVVRQKLLMHAYRPLQKKFLHAMTKIVATSPNYLATSETLTDFAHKTRVIPLGLEPMSYPNPHLSTLQKWHDQWGERFFLFVGVLRYYKGLPILLEACQNADFSVVIVGAGPVEHELKVMVKQLQLKNVHFVGHVSEEDKIALLALSLALVFPSHLRSEAFGVSLLEAAMLGKPLISSEIGTGTSYINIHGETGIIVPPGDPVALRQALQTLWTQPKEVLRMGENALQRFRDLFTTTKMAQHYFELYQEITSDKLASTS